MMLLPKFFCSRILVMTTFLQTVVPVKVKSGVLPNKRHYILPRDV